MKLNLITGFLTALAALSCAAFTACGDASVSGRHYKYDYILGSMAGEHGKGGFRCSYTLKFGDSTVEMYDTRTQSLPDVEGVIVDAVTSDSLVFSAHYSVVDGKTVDLDTEAMPQLLIGEGRLTAPFLNLENSPVIFDNIVFEEVSDESE